MEKMKEEKGITVIAILLIIILILGVIMAVKIFMPKEEIEDESNLVSYNTLIAEQRQEKLVRPIGHTVISIVSSAISLVISVGTSKLYKKLNLSSSIVIFTAIYPIIAMVSGLLPKALGNTVMFISAIIGLITLSQYFKAVGMSTLWPALPLFGGIFISFGAAGMITSHMTRAITGTAGSGFHSLLSLLGTAGIIAFIVAYIISNIKLAKVFEKGRGFTVGLAILPFIFQPILGYEKEN